MFAVTTGSHGNRGTGQAGIECNAAGEVRGHVIRCATEEERKRDALKEKNGKMEKERNDGMGGVWSFSSHCPGINPKLIL